MTTDDLKGLLAEVTPGPWILDPYGINNCLADVWATPRGDEYCICENATIEDARLIALAPQLAEALIEARPVVEKAPCECVETFGAKGSHVDVCDRCKVIARIDAIMEGLADG